MVARAAALEGRRVTLGTAEQAEIARQAITVTPETAVAAVAAALVVEPIKTAAAVAESGY
jgi:hypothetical protein